MREREKQYIDGTVSITRLVHLLVCVGHGSLLLPSFTHQLLVALQSLNGQNASICMTRINKYEKMSLFLD